MSEGWTGAVLAGGRSRRMGRPKALLPGRSGESLAREALRALSDAGAASLLLSCGAPSGELSALADAAPLVPDLRPGRLGPVAGLEALLEASPTEWVVVVACDMPSLDVALLRDLAGRALSSDREAVIPQVDGHLQPLHAAYRRDALPKVRAALDAERLRLMGLARSLDAEIPELAPSPSFESVNTPEQLRDAGLG